MLRKEALSSRERIRLALEHKETDRIPIAMVCSSTDSPAYRELEGYLQKERGISVHEYINPLMNIKGVGPDYIGPKIEDGFDIRLNPS